MKTTGNWQQSSGLWTSPNYQATNESGFSAQPAGALNNSNGYSSFDGVHEYGKFWSSTEINLVDSWSYKIHYYWGSDLNYNMGKLANSKTFGNSCRCVKN